MDKLVAAVIHDAKNALQALDTKLADAASRPAGADFSAARGDVARIAAQLAELLTLFRAQNGQLRLAIDDHDLADFIDDLLAELGPPPAGIRIEAETTAAERIGRWAFDAYLVRLALLDALRNALRHARGVVRLGLDQPAEGGLRFTVADDGPGFPDGVLTGTAAPSAAGTGLGLSFARLIAEHHATPAGQHGRVELANAAGAAGGAILRFILP